MSFGSEAPFGHFGSLDGEGGGAATLPAGDLFVGRKAFAQKFFQGFNDFAFSNLRDGNFTLEGTLATGRPVLNPNFSGGVYTSPGGTGTTYGLVSLTEPANTTTYVAQAAAESWLVSARIMFPNTNLTMAKYIEDANSDMLLFQYGCYDWGDGEMFEVDLTRQFIVADEIDDDAISQLHFTAYFEPDDELRAVGSHDRWCMNHDEVAEFRNEVLNSPALALTAKRHRAKARVDWENV